jgi:hypothetical protein
MTRINVENVGGKIRAICVIRGLSSSRVRRGCPRAARAGAARSVSPIGRNIKQLFKRRIVPINKERFASIYKVASQL